VPHSGCTVSPSRGFAAGAAEDGAEAASTGPGASTSDSAVAAVAAARILRSTRTSLNDAV
jgi:hypothetical protein